MSEARITSMSRTRYQELIKQWLDGTLLANWPDNKRATTKSEQVEERQIKAIAMIYTDGSKTLKDLLSGDSWRELYMVRVGDKIQVQVK
jgi:hypothetical protein